MSDIKSKLEPNWQDNWLINSSGKNILKAFTHSHISSKSMDDVRDLVSIKWDEKKQLPNEIQEILKEISTS